MIRTYSDAPYIESDIFTVYDDRVGERFEIDVVGSLELARQSANEYIRKADSMPVVKIKRTLIVTELIP